MEPDAVLLSDKVELANTVTVVPLAKIVVVDGAGSCTSTVTAMTLVIATADVHGVIDIAEVTAEEVDGVTVLPES